MTPPDKCPKCGAELDKDVQYMPTYVCGTQIITCQDGESIWTHTDLCLMTQRAQRAENRVKELEFKLQQVNEFCIMRSRHRLMQIAQPFHELVNILKQ